MFMRGSGALGRLCQAGSCLGRSGWQLSWQLPQQRVSPARLTSAECAEPLLGRVFAQHTHTEVASQGLPLQPGQLWPTLSSGSLGNWKEDAPGALLTCITCGNT